MKNALSSVLLATSLLLPNLASAHEGGTHPKAVSNAKWQEECASCHVAYPAGLLPERSWRKIMGELDSHFGQNASLDPATQKEITDFLVKNSARGKVDRSIPASQTPVRITELSWFKREHREVGSATWKRPKIGSPSNCKACHQSADQGDFDEDNVVIPR